MRLDDFMAQANATYYATKDPFQDFTTAPEITQVFGELLGLWAAIVWEQLGRPTPIILAELGPGRGTLMRDAQRAIAQTAPAFQTAHRLHLVETSPRLRAQQATLLPQATWHARAEDLPPGPLILLANEFLDALPIRQFIRRGNQWLERHVQNGAFIDHPHSTSSPGEAAQGSDCPCNWNGCGGLTRGPHPSRGTPPAEGTTLEINEPARSLATHLATRLTQQGGAALFLDYGPATSAPGDTLQALHNAHPTNPLTNPGQSDLTAHVDFQTFAAHAQGLDIHGPTPQGPFLAKLGLFQRTGILARTQPPAKAAALIQSAQRLAEPDRMGGLFKAIALCQPGLPTPPGFEP